MKQLLTLILLACAISASAEPADTTYRHKAADDVYFKPKNAKPAPVKKKVKKALPNSDGWILVQTKHFNKIILGNTK